MYIPAIKQ